MYTKLNASRSYVYAVGRACDRGQISRRDCAGAILYSSDRAVEVTMEGMQMLGGNGYINGKRVQPSLCISPLCPPPPLQMTQLTMYSSHPYLRTHARARRIPGSPYAARRTSVHSRSGHARDPTDVDRPNV